MTNHPMGPLYDPLLNLLATQVDDLEGIREATNSRYRVLVKREPDEDGELRGFGLPEDHPEVLKVRQMADDLKTIEKKAISQLERYVRKSPWAAWLSNAPGVGPKSLGRLLGAIGDPYWHPIRQRPRIVSELWSYCGYSVNRIDPGHPPRETHYPPAGIAPAKRRGQKVNWSPEARMRAYLVATACEYQPAGTRYRDVYDEVRARCADAVHVAPCVRCGPSGKPALTGSPLSKAHQQARGLRAIAKEVLRDLWIEGKRLHEAGVSVT